jgi:hypothetical protein
MATTRDRKSVIADIISTNTAISAKEALVFTKIGETGVAIVDYFSDYLKTTAGAKSIADDTDGTLFFVADAYKGMRMFPELLAPNFNQVDFGIKVMGLMHFFLFKAKMQEVIENQWDTSVMICKTDALFYANKFYNIIKEETDPKYQPLRESLAAYYKKTKQSSDTTDTTTKAKSKSKPKAKPPIVTPPTE